MKDESVTISTNSTNPCCRVWEDRVLKLQHKVKKTEDGRSALKKAVGIYEHEFQRMQNESENLKKAYEEEKLQTEHERKEKEKESATRVSLENEITSLKAEILSLNQKGGSTSENVSEELILLKGRVSDKEKELNRLQEEKNRATAEKRRIEQELSNLKTRLANVEAEKKRLMQDLQKEKKRANAEVEGLKAEKKNNDLVLLQSEKQNLETEIGRLKELLENERKRADCEAKKAEVEKKNAHKVKEMLKAAEQRKVVDVDRRKTEELEQQLQRCMCEADEAKSKLVSEGLKVKEANKKFEAEKKKSIKEKKKAEEQQKIAEMSTKHALEEKQNAARLQQQLEECQNKYEKLVGNGVDLDKETGIKKVEEMYKLQAMKEKSRADKLAQQLEDTKKRTKNENLTDTMKTKSVEMKLLKKRLKLEKARVKHFIQVAELEKKCKKTVEEELHRLKAEFARFSSRVGLCGCFDVCNVGTPCLEKNDNVNSKRKFMQTGSGKELAKPTKPSEYFKPNLDTSVPSLPISGTCTESTSGTASKMEPLRNKKNLNSFALVSSMASFSDRQLAVPISRLSSENAEVADNHVKIPLKASNKDGNRNAVVADNNVISPLKARNKDGNTKKRKRLVSAVEAVELLSTEGKTGHGKIAKIIDKPLAIEHTKEDVDFNVCKDDLENFKKMFDGDCMKLLSFDSEVEEERYRVAFERPLSPTLPNIEFQSNLNHLDVSRPSESEISIIAIESWSIVVLSEIRDSGSLSKILHMTKTFSSHGGSFSQSDLVVKNVISTLSADEILSTKEKVCVFFSLVLKGFSSITLTNFSHAIDGNFLSSIHIVSGKLKKVMSDVDTRTKFAKVCVLDELTALIQDFLVNGETLVCTSDTSSETLSLPCSKASLHELVIGAVLLASVCEAFDRVDLISEVSYNISRVTSSSTLTLLHVFAYVCGEKLLPSGDNSLITTVIKSLVTYCEREHLSGFPACAKCPFSIGAVSVEDLASLLLKKVSDYSTHMFGMVTCKSLTVPDDALSALGDVLSLLELLATKMSWSWVYKNIVSELLKMLEACVMETPLTSIFALLGQMARLGVDANGFEDAEVESIRVNLISFITRSSSSKISLPVQFAAVNALLGTTPLSFLEICKISLEQPSPVSSANAIECIQRWFSSLSDERKSLSVRLLTADAS